MGENELLDKLNSVLSNPEMLKSAMEIAQSLNPGKTDNAAPLEMNNNQNARDPKTALLYALRPFLSEEKQDKIDKIAKILSMGEIASLVKNIM